MELWLFSHRNRLALHLLCFIIPPSKEQWLFSHGYANLINVTVPHVSFLQSCSDRQI